VLETWNGGGRWKQVATLPANPTGLVVPSTVGSAIQFVSSTEGFAVAPDKTLYVTHDGGITWSPIAHAALRYAGSVNLVGSHGCVGNAYEGGALTTTNGGATWTATSESLSTCLAAIVPSWARAIVPKTGAANLVAANGTGRIAWFEQSNNAVTVLARRGATSVQIAIPASFWLPIQNFAWSSAQDGWLLTQGGLGFYVTRDGGRHWKEIS
jgi:photosystem II stability/assembly factor-like uncharacterized protein